MRVLHVEDDDLLSRAMRRLLKKRGGDVIRAADGTIAMEILASHAAFHLVLSDVEMPHLDGLGLLRWIRVHRSDLVRRCIFTTGNTDSLAAREIARSHVHPVFAKPVDYPALFALIDTILAAP